MGSTFRDCLNSHLGVGDVWFRLGKYSVDGLLLQRLRQRGAHSGYQLLLAQSEAVKGGLGQPLWAWQDLTPEEEAMLAVALVRDDIAFCQARLAKEKYRPVKPTGHQILDPIQIQALEAKEATMAVKAKTRKATPPTAEATEMDLGSCHEFHSPSEVPDHVWADNLVEEARSEAPAQAVPPPQPPTQQERIAEAEKTLAGKAKQDLDSLTIFERVHLGYCTQMLHTGRLCRNKTGGGGRLLCSVHEKVAERKIASGLPHPSEWIRSGIRHVGAIMLRMWQPPAEVETPALLAPERVEKEHTEKSVEFHMTHAIREGTYVVTAHEDPTGGKRAALAKTAQQKGVPLFVAWAGDSQAVPLTINEVKRAENGAWWAHCVDPRRSGANPKRYCLNRIAMVRVDKHAISSKLMARLEASRIGEQPSG